MCTQLVVDGEEIPTSPGTKVPVMLPSSERAPTRIPLSKTAFAREFHLWRMQGRLPCASEAEAFEVAKQRVTTKYGAAQVMWFHSGFAKGYIAGVSRFAEKNPDFDPTRKVNEETNPFFLWFDAPEGLVVPVVLSVDTFRWNPKKREGLRVVANIVTRDAGVIVPPEVHGREPYFMRVEDWLGDAPLPKPVTRGEV